jgi:hypothetical protein
MRECGDRRCDQRATHVARRIRLALDICRGAVAVAKGYAMPPPKPG